MSIEQNRKSANSVTVQGRIIETNMKFDKNVTDFLMTTIKVEL